MRNIVKLEDVCDFYRGLTYSKKDEATSSNKIVLRASNIDLKTSTLDFEDLKYLKEDFVIPEDKKLHKNCIFICMSSGSKSHLGKVAFIDREYDYAFGGFMGLIKPKENILPKYLFYLLKTPEYKSLIERLSNGININNIKFSDIKEFRFELPSLEEQNAILNILDKAEEIRAKKKLANDKLDEFLKSTFINVCKNSKNTIFSKLEEVANVNYGTRVVKRRDQGSIYPVYGGGGETFRMDKYNRENCVVISRFAMSPLCTRYVREKIFLNDSGLTVSTKDENVLLQKFLNWCILSRNNEIYSLGRGAAQKNLEMSSFNAMTISYPCDIIEQNKFILIADKVEQQKQKNKKVIEQMDNLFNSLSQKAFKNAF